MAFGFRQARQREERGMPRRLRQLVASRELEAGGDRLSRTDVEVLARDRSPATRARIARKFGHQYDQLAEGCGDLARGVLELLVADVAREVRAALAEAVADSNRLPPAVARRLARDDIEVAQPILERSPVLDDEELLEIVRTHAWPYALAVAGRRVVSERLAEALVEHGNARVAARLADNPGADLTRRVLTRMVETYGGEREVRDRLARRPALPFELMARLVERVGEQLSWELVRSRRMDPDEARRLVMALRDRIAVGLTARDHRTHELVRRMRRRFLAGDLSPDEVLEYLRDGDIAALEAALAAMADVPVTAVRHILTASDRRLLAALCARAGLPTAHHLALRMALELAATCFAESRARTYDEETARFVCEQYERLRADPATVEALLAPVLAQAG